MKAFLVVDMQNDFMPGGALGVRGADEIIPIINRLIPTFSLVVATKDWHPPNHCSFAVNHPGKKVGDVVDVKGVSQILWPTHCVRGTSGAEFVEGIDQESFVAIFYKGTDQSIDSYSAFYDNAKQKSTGLANFLKSRHVTEIYLAGVATDYCVLYSALDAMDEGFKVAVVIDACHGINLQPNDIENGLAAIGARGGRVVTSREM